MDLTTDINTYERRLHKALREQQKQIVDAMVPFLLEHSRLMLADKTNFDTSYSVLVRNVTSMLTGITVTASRNIAQDHKLGADLARAMLRMTCKKVERYLDELASGLQFADTIRQVHIETGEDRAFDFRDHLKPGGAA